MLNGYFQLGDRRIKNTILSYGRRKMLQTAFMGVSPEIAWYIGLISEIDMSLITDGHTFADKTWTEYQDYLVEEVSGRRVTFTPREEQTVSGIIEYDTLLIKSTAETSVTVKGMFLCDRLYNDDQEFNIFSIGLMSPAVIIYPDQEIAVGYTIAYQ